MSAQVQSKAKTIDTVISTQSSLKESTTEDDQMEEDLNDLTKFKRILNVLRQKEEMLLETNDARSLAQQMLKISDTMKMKS
ncbi:hypothetical protein SKUD_175603 [Saccharomyces kudriavzevii IFO 1802]|uniref:Uncharacterized protein n=1 Tax=Saccharomyces kudriavzevii (strain ATCC MYA-4449 / AS 2.2408 / CBS 8840 / NBRC 1802 / NCYC 2889) TaxID=226230 RepID=J4TWZ9_SACK1|nr:hypothetical protein SKUD_175603 [Saccharomyces kudriavzevii IFO 1802]